MKLSRVLLLVTFTLLFTGWLQADVVDNTHFFISLNDSGNPCNNNIVPGTTDPCNEGDEGGGWAAAQGGKLDGTVNPGCPEEGCPTNSEVCVGDCSESFLLSHDPSAGTRLGGKSDPITPSFEVFVDSFGGGTRDFQNTLGFDITTLKLQFTLPDPGPGESLIFFCNGGNAFDECGFVFGTGDLNGAVIFSGGHVESTTVPEPSTWILLGSAAIAIAGRRALRRA